MNTVMVVAAHPDDEVLGCGGTLARHAAAGDRVELLLVADGVTGRAEAASKAEQAARLAAAEAAARALGARPPRSLLFPDNRLDTVALLDVVRRIEECMAEVRPDIVYTHHAGDLNIDHELVHRAVLTACRPLPGSTVRALYTFEVLSSTEWRPGARPFDPVRYVDIGATLERKMAALRCYGAEMRPFPHARSYEAVEALAKLRGAQAGMAAAEAFGVLRAIER
jgi:LmbE family N-acetylglucosaminyl deacetylase